MLSMKYEEAITYIEQLGNRGISLGLERIQALLERLGNPQQQLACIHVAGTNGKGSVCAFLDAVLCRAGYRTGRYLSPTLFDYRERIQCNGQMIAKTDVAQLLSRIRAVCQQMVAQGLEHPTAFEVETAMAFLYFSQQQCDYVLLEVGMGGLLDSTNVIQKPVLSVITGISLDHTAMLGHSLQEIAAQKAGIIKAGCPVVLGPQPPEAMAVLQQRCSQCGIEPATVRQEEIRPIHWSLQGQCFSYGSWQQVTIGLLGQYQCVNGAIALEALQALSGVIPLTELQIRAGMAEATWPGRFEILHHNPVWIVDGAHNPAGAQGLAQTLAQLQGQTIGLVMGVFADKDYREMLSVLQSCSHRLICFTPRQARGLDSRRLAEAAAPCFEQVQDAGTAEAAVQLAMQDNDKNIIWVSFGSLSTVGEIRDALRRWEDSNETN